MATPVEQRRLLNDGRSEESSGKRPAPGWLLLLIIILFPIPFTPWWLGLICLFIFACLMYVLTRPTRT